jgi:hypothetical protein
VHAPVQQLLAPEQVPPVGVQAAAAHIPLVHVLLQQSLACAQACPVARQRAPEQVPAEHESLQQSVYDSQAAPAIRHLPGGTGIFEPTSPLASIGCILPVSPPPPVSVGEVESIIPPSG